MVVDSSTAAQKHWRHSWCGADCHSCHIHLPDTREMMTPWSMFSFHLTSSLLSGDPSWFCSPLRQSGCLKDTSHYSAFCQPTDCRLLSRTVSSLALRAIDDERCVSRCLFMSLSSILSVLFLNFLNGHPASGSVRQSPIISFVEQCSARSSPAFTLSVTWKFLVFMCFILLVHEAFLFHSI